MLVLPITTTRRDLPSHVELEPGASGLGQTSHAKAEDVKSVWTHRLNRRLGVIPADRLTQAGRAVRLLPGG